MVDFEKIEKDDHFIPDGMNGFERNTKRIIDCLTALVAMIVFSPLFLFCYIAVKRVLSSAKTAVPPFSSKSASAVSVARSTSTSSAA